MVEPEKSLVFEASEDDFGALVIAKSRELPVVVQFYADWCMPCQMLAPMLESAVLGFKGKCILARVNIDSNTYLSNQYGIFSVPSVKLIMGGKVVSDFSGLVPEEFIKSWLDMALNKHA